MSQGYSLSGYDNDSFMCSSTDRVFDNMNGLEVCPKCGYRTNFNYINSEFRVKRRTNDISYTYDGYCIVSLKFKEACERAHFQGMQFVQLPSDSEYFYLMPSCVVKFDTEKRKTRFEKKCEVCGYYEAVAGATPAFIKEVLTADICKTDILFGSGNAKHPIVLITKKAKEVFEQEKLKGIIVEEIRT
jgi:hypothetical protein